MRHGHCAPALVVPPRGGAPIGCEQPMMRHGHCAPTLVVPPRGGVTNRVRAAIERTMDGSGGSPPRGPEAPGEKPCVASPGSRATPCPASGGRDDRGVSVAPGPSRELRRPGGYTRGRGTPAPTRRDAAARRLGGAPARRRPAGPEILYLRRSPDLKFMGGYWVFPGGRIDPGDHLRDGGSLTSWPRRDRRRRARRTRRQGSPSTPRPCIRYASGRLRRDEPHPVRHVVLRGGGRPSQRSRRRGRDRGAPLVAAARGPAGAPRPAHPVREPDVRAQHPARRTRHRRRGARRRRHLAPGTPAGTPASRRRRSRVALYAEDCGYETGDLDCAGPRHRIWMLDGAWRYEREFQQSAPSARGRKSPTAFERRCIRLRLFVGYICPNIPSARLSEKAPPSCSLAPSVMQRTTFGLFSGRAFEVSTERRRLTICPGESTDSTQRVIASLFDVAIGLRCRARTVVLASKAALGKRVSQAAHWP